MHPAARLRENGTSDMRAFVGWMTRMTAQHSAMSRAIAQPAAPWASSAARRTHTPAPPANHTRAPWRVGSAGPDEARFGRALYGSGLGFMTGNPACSCCAEAPIERAGSAQQHLRDERGQACTGIMWFTLTSHMRLHATQQVRSGRQDGSTSAHPADVKECAGQAGSHAPKPDELRRLVGAQQDRLDHAAHEAQEMRTRLQVLGLGRVPAARQSGG